MRKKMDLESMIADSEPETFSYETANGSGRWATTGYNYEYQWTRSPAPEGPTRPLGRTNRGNE